MSTPAKPAAESCPLVAVTGAFLLGGASLFAINLFRGFRELGLPLPVISMDAHNELAGEVTRFGVDIRFADRRRIYEDRLLWAYRELARHRPRAVLSCLGAESFEMLRLVPPGVLRVGLIQSHDPGPYATARRYAPWIDAMAGVSREICDELRDMPEFSSARIVHVPYGIHFTDTPAKPARAVGAPLRVIYVGRLIEEQKRVSRLAEVARRLAALAQAVEFTFVGSGPAEASLRASVANLGSVRFTGTVPNAEVAPLLREHDIFLLLSDYEGLPLSLIEAMGEGVVPVVSDLPSGIMEAVPDGCGVRVPVGDVAAATGALTELAQDRARLAAYSTAARAHARGRFGANRMAADYLALAEPASGADAWPENICIPAPLGVNPWLFQGPARILRRWVKRLRGPLNDVADT